jgi:hypothetical protein
MSLDQGVANRHHCCRREAAIILAAGVELGRPHLACSLKNRLELEKGKLRLIFFLLGLARGHSWESSWMKTKLSWNAVSEGPLQVSENRRKKVCLRGQVGAASSLMIGFVIKPEGCSECWWHVEKVG